MVCGTCTLFLRRLVRNKREARAVSEVSLKRFGAGALAEFSDGGTSQGIVARQILLYLMELHICSLLLQVYHLLHLFINSFHKHLLSTRQMCGPLETQRWPRHTTLLKSLSAKGQRNRTLSKKRE